MKGRENPTHRQGKREGERHWSGDRSLVSIHCFVMTSGPGPVFLNVSRFVSPFSGVFILLLLSPFHRHGFSLSSLLFAPSLYKEIEDRNSAKFSF